MGLENKLLESIEEMQNYELCVDGKSTGLVNIADAIKVLENLEIKLT